MSTPVGIAPIVVGIDGSESGLEAARWAAALAQRLGAPLSLVHAVPRLPRDPYPTTALYINDLRKAARADGSQLLAAARAAVADIAPEVQVAEAQYDGGAVEVLSRLSAAAHMVVIGAVGRIGLADLMIGSTALGLPPRSHAPVVVARSASNPAADTGPVVVAVAGLPLDEAPVDFAFEFASRSGADLVAVHAWSDAALPEFDRIAGGAESWKGVEEREKRLLSESLAGQAARYPDVRVDEVVVADRPAQALVDYSTRARLVVVGTRGRGALASTLLGSTSRAVAKLAHCPVAIIREET